MFWSMQNRMLSMTTSGWVKSTTTCAPASATLNSHSPCSTMATSSRSSAASIAFTTSVPIRPRAPRTATEITGASPPDGVASCCPGTEVLVVTPPGFPAGGPDATSPAPSQSVEVGLGVRADHGEAGRSTELLGCDGPDGGLVDRVDPGENLPYRLVLPVGQLTLPEPAHAGAGVLETQDETTAGL